MRSRTTHQLDEVPVFTCRIAVALNVTDELRVSLTSCIETERSLNLLVLQVTIDSLRTSDYLNAILLSSVVLCKYTSIGVRVVTTDDYESLDTKFAKNLDTLLKLVFLLQLSTARADDIKTTSIAVLVHDFRSNLHVVVIYETTRTENETIKFVSWVESLYTIEKTRNHVVTTRSLTTREDNTYIERREFLSLTSFESDDRHSVCIREQCLDFILITY